MNDLHDVLKRADPLSLYSLKALSAAEVSTVGQALCENSTALGAAHQAPQTPRARYVRWWPRVVAPLALVGVLGGVSLTRHGGTYALAQQATPQVISFQHGSHDAAAVFLRDAATRAASASTGAGAVLHSVTQSWTLSTDVHRKTSTSSLLTSTRELWITPEGTGRLVDTTKDTPVTSGQALRNSKAVRRSSSTFSPTTFANSNSGLPADAAALAPVVRERSRSMGLSPNENVGGHLLDNIEEGTATAPQQAAMLAVLAEVPQVFDAGPVTDRAGRAGHAVGLVTSGPTSPTTGTVYLIVDPRTGLPLASETMWTPDPPRGLHLRPGPMVAEYHLYLASGKVASVG